MDPAKLSFFSPIAARETRGDGGVGIEKRRGCEACCFFAPAKANRERGGTPPGISILSSLHTHPPDASLTLPVPLCNSFFFFPSGSRFRNPVSIAASIIKFLIHPLPAEPFLVLPQTQLHSHSHTPPQEYHHFEAVLPYLPLLKSYKASQLLQLQLHLIHSKAAGLLLIKSSQPQQKPPSCARCPTCTCWIPQHRPRPPPHLLLRRRYPLLLLLRPPCLFPTMTRRTSTLSSL